MTSWTFRVWLVSIGLSDLSILGRVRVNKYTCMAAASKSYPRRYGNRLTSDSKGFTGADFKTSEAATVSYDSNLAVEVDAVVFQTLIILHSTHVSINELSLCRASFRETVKERNVLHAMLAGFVTFDGWFSEVGAIDLFALGVEHGQA